MSLIAVIFLVNAIWGVNLYATHPYKITEQTYTRNCHGISGQFKNILNPSNPYTNVTKKNITDLKIQ